MLVTMVTAVSSGSKRGVKLRPVTEGCNKGCMSNTGDLFGSGFRFQSQRLWWEMHEWAVCDNDDHKEGMLCRRLLGSRHSTCFQGSGNSSPRLDVVDVPNRIWLGSLQVCNLASRLKSGDLCVMRCFNCNF